MRKPWAELSRVEEVRDSARGWKSAGAIDAPTLGAIEAAYPDPRVRLHGFWRVLVFVLVSVISNALIWFIFSGAKSLFAMGLVFGALLAGATEALRGSRYAGTGADSATSFWSVTYLLTAGRGPVVPRTADGRAGRNHRDDRGSRHRGRARGVALGILVVRGLRGGGRSTRCSGGCRSDDCSGSAWPSRRCGCLRPRLDSARLVPAHRRCAAALFAVSAGRALRRRSISSASTAT
jgi:hypothetical protein